MVARVQLCGKEQSGAWNAAVVYGLSYQVLSIPLRSLKHHVAVRLHALNQLGGKGVMMMDRGVICEGGGEEIGEGENGKGKWGAGNRITIATCHGDLI